MLTDSQVVEVANYDAVKKIQRVKGPKAQGTTDAWVAHRFADMDGANEPSNIPGKPALTGAGVVIGVISLPVTQLDVTDLITDTSLPPLYNDAEEPPSDDSRLYLYRGYTKDDANDPDVDLDVISTSGVDAGLNMVQVIRDIAPHAKFVLASPGLTSDPQDMANLIAALAEGRGSPGDTGYIPPADIIVDDLDYLTQNPFEVDLISDAIAAAETAGTMYVTAAGDHGYVTAAGDDVYHQSTDSTSNVHVAAFNGVESPTDFFDDPFVNNLHRFSDGSYYITVEQPLTDLCLFWAEDPGSGTDGNDLDLFVWNDVSGDGKVDYDTEIVFDTFLGDFDGPGYCLLESGEQISTGSRILLGDFNATNTNRFMLIGERADSSFVNQQGADDISATFSVTTRGAIRGHAYFGSALTVGGAQYIEENNAVVPFWDADVDVLAGSVTANAYSSDGEVNTRRFFWRKDDLDQWQSVPITDSVSSPQKPNLVAASAIGVRAVTQNSDEEADPSTPATIADQIFYGTSASAAVVAATAALYWQFREWQIDESLVSGPDVSPEDIRRAVTASTQGNTDSWSQSIGNGVLDAPKALESPLPPSELTLVESQPGVLTLNYNRAFNDLDANAVFLYSVDCAYPNNDELIDEINIEPADSGEGSAGSTKAPINLYPPNNRIGEEVTCEVTTTHPQSGLGWKGSGSADALSVTTALSPPSVAMTAKSAGVTMQFAASTDDDVANLEYSAACTANGNAINGWPTADGVVMPSTPYNRPAEPGVNVACTVTASLERGGDPGLALTAQDSASARAGSPVATTVTMAPDSGGVSVRWAVDPNLVTGVNTSFTLLCTQGGVRLVDNQPVSGAAYFVEADQSAPVQCSVTTQISGAGISTINQSAVSASATAEEEQASGLPVWLLYIATQPQ